MARKRKFYAVISKGMSIFNISKTSAMALKRNMKSRFVQVYPQIKYLSNKKQIEMDARILAKRKIKIKRR